MSQVLIKEGDTVEDTSMFYIILAGTIKVCVITPANPVGFGQEVATLSVGEVRTRQSIAFRSVLCEAGSQLCGWECNVTADGWRRVIA